MTNNLEREYGRRNLFKKGTGSLLLFSGSLIAIIGADSFGGVKSHKERCYMNPYGSFGTSYICSVEEQYRKEIAESPSEMNRHGHLRFTLTSIAGLLSSVLGASLLGREDDKYV